MACASTTRVKRKAGWSARATTRSARRVPQAASACPSGAYSVRQRAPAPRLQDVGRSVACAQCSIHVRGEGEARRARRAGQARAPWLAMRCLPSRELTSKRSNALMLRVVAKGETRSACAYGAYMGTMMSASGRTCGRPGQAQPSAMGEATGTGVRLKPTQAATGHCAPLVRHGRVGTCAQASRACRPMCAAGQRGARSASRQAPPIRTQTRRRRALREPTSVSRGLDLRPASLDS